MCLSNEKKKSFRLPNPIFTWSLHHHDNGPVYFPKRFHKQLHRFLRHEWNIWLNFWLKTSIIYTIYTERLAQFPIENFIDNFESVHF